MMLIIVSNRNNDNTESILNTIKLTYSYMTDPIDGGVTRTNSTEDDGDGGGELVRST